VRDAPINAPLPHQAPLGNRLAGLALLCVTLFGLATLVGLFANGF
jgi:hypothetical protein